MSKQDKVIVSITREGDDLWRGTVRKRGQVIASATRHKRFGPFGVTAYCQQVAMEHENWIVTDYVIAPDA
jgi:hypothetical protein